MCTLAMRESVSTQVPSLGRPTPRRPSALYARFLDLLLLNLLGSHSSIVEVEYHWYCSETLRGRPSYPSSTMTLSLRATWSPCLGRIARLSPIVHGLVVVIPLMSLNKIRFEAMKWKKLLLNFLGGFLNAGMEGSIRVGAVSDDGRINTYGD